MAIYTDTYNKSHKVNLMNYDWLIDEDYTYDNIFSFTPINKNTKDAEDIAEVFKHDKAFQCDECGYYSFIQAIVDEERNHVIEEVAYMRDEVDWYGSEADVTRCDVEIMIELTTKERKMFQEIIDERVYTH